MRVRDATTRPEGSDEAPQGVGFLLLLDDEERQLVERESEWLTVAPGDAICIQGDVANRFYVLLEGEVVVERDGLALARLGAGAYFGESGLLMRGRRSATVRAVRPSKLWSVGESAFQRVLCHHLLAEHDVRLDVLGRIKQTPPGAFR
jgi:CRP-like cAMP-binding protein